MGIPQSRTLNERQSSTHAKGGHGVRKVLHPKGLTTRKSCVSSELPTRTVTCAKMHLAFSEPTPFVGQVQWKCKMASIPGTRPRIICHEAADQALTFFSRALKDKTGLDCRSSGTALLTRDGAINVQVPSADVSQALTSRGMVLKILPRNTEWSRWHEMGCQYQYRDYDMGVARFPTPAQRMAGDGGPILGAGQVSLRVVLKLG